MGLGQRDASGVGMIRVLGRMGLAALWLMPAGASAVPGQRPGAPVAIISQISGDEGVEITQEDLKIQRKGAAGELLFPGDRVKGLAIVAECRGAGSLQWNWLRSAAYVAGKGVEGAGESGPIPDCRMPEAAPPASQAHDDALTAQQLEAKLAGASATDFATAALAGLTPYDRQNGMSVLRRAQAIEDRGQLKAAIDVYTDLSHLWEHAGWVLPKIARLRIALANKLLASPARPGQGHITPLVIGVSKYSREDPDYLPLRYAHLDAQAFAAYLKQVDPERKFDALTNRCASRANIQEQLSRLRAQAGDGSTAVVFVSAHGFQDSMGSYVAAYDAHQRVGIDTAVPVAEILSALRGFEGAYVFVDACRTKSSTGANNVNAVLSSYGHEGYGLLGLPPPQPRTFLLTSTTPGSYSEEDSQFKDEQGPLAQAGHGAFTYYLLKFLYLDAAAQPRRLTRGQLLEGLKQAMQGLKHKQTPDGGGPFGDTDRLDPLRRLPYKPETRTTSFLDLFRAPVRLAAYAPEPQADVTQEALDLLRARLGRGAINPAVARQAVEGYRQLNAVNRVQVRGTIRTALEDEGERLLLNYLDGYQLAPDRGQFRDANVYYTLASELAPESPLLRARAAFNAGREKLFDLPGTTDQQRRVDILRAATQELFDAYREDPGPYVLNALGIAYMEMGEWDKAIPAFDDATRLAPGWLYPKHNRALSLMRSGKARAAIEEYRKAIAEAPSAHTLHFNLALAYQQINELRQAEGQYEAAEKLLRKASGIEDADWARLYNAQGTLAAQRGRKGKAMELYKLALKKAPGMPEAVHNQALISPRAEKEKLLSLNRGYLNSRIELAQMWKKEGRVKDAIAEYEGIVKQRDDFAGAHLELAQLYLRSGGTVQERVLRAVEQMGKAAKAEPLFWKLYLVKAEAARVQGQNAEAKRHYQEARRRAPDRTARREISESEKGKWLH